MPNSTPASSANSTMNSIGDTTGADGSGASGRSGTDTPDALTEAKRKYDIAEAELEQMKREYQNDMSLWFSPDGLSRFSEKVNKKVELGIAAIEQAVVTLEELKKIETLLKGVPFQVAPLEEPDRKKFE